MGAETKGCAKGLFPLFWGAVVVGLATFGWVLYNKGALAFIVGGGPKADIVQTTAQPGTQMMPQPGTQNQAMMTPVNQDRMRGMQGNMGMMGQNMAPMGQMGGMGPMTPVGGMRWVGGMNPSPQQGNPGMMGVAMGPSLFGDVIQNANQVVVNISATSQLPVGHPQAQNNQNAMEPPENVNPAGQNQNPELNEDQRKQLQRQKDGKAQPPGALAFVDPFSGPTVESIGSGAIICPHGHILTNFHVIERASAIFVTTYVNGKKSRHAAVVQKADKALDLAVLKIDTGQNLPFAALADSDAVQVGDPVIAIGSPWGLSQTVTQGIISAKRQTITIQGVRHANLFQTDASINRGNSGGPLINTDGLIVGINTAIFTTNGAFAGVGFTIPSNTAKQFLMDAGVALPDPMMAQGTGMNANADRRMGMQGNMGMNANADRRMGMQGNRGMNANADRRMGMQGNMGMNANADRRMGMQGNRGMNANADRRMGMNANADRRMGMNGMNGMNANMNRGGGMNMAGNMGMGQPVLFGFSFGKAPNIRCDAQMPHPFWGDCADCHTFKDAPCAVNPMDRVLKARGQPAAFMNVTMMGSGTNNAGGVMGSMNSFPAVPSNFGVTNFVGMNIQEVNPIAARQFDADPNRGVLVRTVAMNSPAIQANLLPGDIILKVDGRAINGPKMFHKMVHKSKKGKPIRVFFMRKGVRKETEMTVGATPTSLNQVFPQPMMGMGNNMMGMGMMGMGNNDDNRNMMMNNNMGMMGQNMAPMGQMGGMGPMTLVNQDRRMGMNGMNANADRRMGMNGMNANADRRMGMQGNMGMNGMNANADRRMRMQGNMGRNANADRRMRMQGNMGMGQMGQVTINNLNDTNWMGMDLNLLTPRKAMQRGLAPNTTGLRVRDVNNNSMARMAGIQRGDIIKSINNVRIVDATSAVRALNAAMAGNRFELEIQRFNMIGLVVLG